MATESNQSGHGVVSPQSLTAGWTSVFTNLSAADSAGDQVSDFAASVIGSSTVSGSRIYEVSGGTLIVPRLGYAVATTAVTTQSQIVAWGRRRSDGDEGWQVLRTKAGAVYAELTTNIGTGPGSDIKGSTYAYTSPDLDTQAFDRCGCDQVFFLIKQAFDGDSTDATTVLQVKMI